MQQLKLLMQQHTSSIMITMKISSYQLLPGIAAAASARTAAAIPGIYLVFYLYACLHLAAVLTHWI
jgi:hypothetical protein